MLIVRSRYLKVPDFTDYEILEIIKSVQRITCKQRSFTEIDQEMLRIHFATSDDAISFFETFCYLLERMSNDPQDLTELSGETTQSDHPVEIRASLNPDVSASTIEAARKYLQTFACGVTAWSDNKGIWGIWFQKSSDLDMFVAQYPGLILETKLEAR